LSVRETLSRLFGGALTSLNGSAYPTGLYTNRNIEPQELPAAEMYRLLKTLYLGNGAYDTLAYGGMAVGRATPQIKAIRSPIVPVVQWFSQKTYPKPLEVVTENDAIIEPIGRVHTWSNWRAKSSMAAGGTALYGEYWIKVQADPLRGRVWFEYLEPCYVTDFEEDARGFCQYVRVDIPKCDEDAPGGRRVYTHTEEWSTAEQTYRRWETDGDACGRKIGDLGTPAEEEPFSDYGIDFTPFVRTVFSDIGEKRGVGAVQLALEAIFEADLSATNLHAMLYQDADGAWVATANGADAQGRPIPPMSMPAAQPTYDALGRQTNNGIGKQSDGSVTVGKRQFWSLPGGYDLKSVVADINYAASLAILQDHDEQMERLMPALAYSRISRLSGQPSGRAIRYLMSAAIDQVVDVRATALEKLAQADAMALTLGQVNGIPGFEGVGSFDAGDFEHTFKEVAVIEVDELEEAQADLARGQAAQAWVAAGVPFATVLTDVLDYTEQEATDITDMATAEAEQAAQRQQDIFAAQPPPNGQQGGPPNA
jgi:hypothetical protein